MAEIPESLDAQPDQLVRKVDGTLPRYAQHSHHRLVGGAERLQIIQRVDRHPGHLPADQLRVDVKDSQQPVAVGIPRDKAGHGGAQPPGADQYGGQQFAGAEQQLADLRQQNLHLVPDALLPEPAEAVEVLADLAGGGAHHLGQFAGRDLVTAFRCQCVQVAVVFRQPLDDRQGDLGLCGHGVPPLTAHSTNRRPFDLHGQGRTHSIVDRKYTGFHLDCQFFI